MVLTRSELIGSLKHEVRILQHLAGKVEAKRFVEGRAFEIGAPQAFGNAGVGIMRGPGYANFDFTLAKDFQLDAERRIQFRTEIFNAFNRANFGPPNIARDSSGFGQILAAGNARIVQFGLKFYF